MKNGFDAGVRSSLRVGVHRLALAVYALGLATACTAPTLPGYGNFGGAARAPQAARPIPAYDPAVIVRWFPIQAKFAPDGSWLVVNLCNYYNPHYCRLVRWEPGGTGQSLEDGQLSSGRWRAIGGQDPDKSYLWPSISWDGKKLTFTVADCDAERPKDWLQAVTTPGALLPPPTRCAIFEARPAVSGAVDDIRVGYRELPIPSAARPTWRPDDKAIIYWRVLGQATLASGRQVGSRSVYEYDLELDLEEGKLDSVVSKLSWTNEFAAVHYAPNGKSFSTCGFTYSKAADTFVGNGILCFKASARGSGPVSPLNAKGEGAFLLLYADWRGSHFLAEAANQLYLSDKRDRRLEEIFRDSRADSTIANADIAGTSGDVIVVRETLLRGMEPIRGSFKGHYKPSSLSVLSVALLSYLSRSAGQSTPILWPNIESLDQ